jgi:hypothetical protein
VRSNEASLLIATKQAGKESWLLWIIGMALALLRLRDAAHDLGDVLTAAGPGWFGALTAADLTTHLVISCSGGFGGSDFASVRVGHFFMNLNHVQGLDRLDQFLEGCRR